MRDYSIFVGRERGETEREKKRKWVSKMERSHVPVLKCGRSTCLVNHTYEVLCFLINLGVPTFV